MRSVVTGLTIRVHQIGSHIILDTNLPATNDLRCRRASQTLRIGISERESFARLPSTKACPGTR
jgi:hypothetical protein